ncbi:MAG: hypothetical protein E7552_06665 [Ruminococcaceae bacterium]|nr:hypothetical protein [Oscillospiraceae bacterium]
MNVVLLTLAVFLAGTIVLESIPTLFLRDRKGWRRTSLICNLVTNPILNVIMMLVYAFLPQQWLVALILFALEIAVVFIEAYFYRCRLRVSYRACLLFSLVANALSFGVGFSLRGILLM